MAVVVSPDARTRRSAISNEECQGIVVDLADDSTTIYTGPCQLMGIYVNTILSAHIVLIKDGALTMGSLHVSMAAGTNLDFHGMRFDTSLIIDPDNASTGKLLVMWRKINHDASA